MTKKGLDGKDAIALPLDKDADAVSLPFVHNQDHADEIGDSGGGADATLEPAVTLIADGLGKLKPVSL